jgi:hypothetical protein
MFLNKYLRLGQKRDKTAFAFKKDRRFFRPRMEVLEDRCLLSPFLVTNTGDSGTGSLRQAILDSNATSGPNTIDFAIMGTGVQSIAPTSPLPTISVPVVIDGTTEVGAAIELNGTNAGAGVDGLFIQANNTTIKGLAINHFGGYGIHLKAESGDTIQNCFIGTNFGGTAAAPNSLGGIWIDGTQSTSASNTIGGSTAGAGNVISGNGGAGINVDGNGASSNVIQGNFIGTNAAGTSALGNGGDGVLINTGANNTVGDGLGDTTTAARNIISGNVGDGIHIQNLTATDNVVSGNYIGVNAAGTGVLGNQSAGVELDGAQGTFLGFKVVNVIGGNAIGVVLDNGAQDNAVVNNFIGVGFDGVTPLGNLGQGIALHSSGTPAELPVQNNAIGGTAGGTGNTIAFNGKAGVAIFGLPLAGNGQQNNENRILGNSIFGNGTSNPTTDVGIDLVATTTFPNGDGPTANTPGGPHIGPNNLQNFPVLTGAAVNRNNAGTIVAGSLNSTPNTMFRIELFDNTAASQTGFGQGKTFLTFLNVTTDANGNAAFSAVLTPTVSVGHFLTATATDPNGNTSEFSKAIQVTTAGQDILGRINENGQWWVAQSTGSGFANRLWATWNPAATWVDLVTGDFNGDGVTDFAGRVDESGQWWVALSNGSSFTTSLWATWNPNVFWTNVVVGDFLGNGRSDIGGWDPDTGNWWVAVSTGSNSFASQLWTTWNPNATWDDVMVGRFTNSSKDDLIGRVDETGQWWVAASTGSNFTNQLWATWSTGVTWVDVQVADFNHDGRSDITARAQEVGQWWTGLSNGAAFMTSLWTSWSTGVTWVDVQVGDFNGDGNMDIAGRAEEIGQWWVGISKGTSFTNQLWTTWSTGVSWQDIQVGDFNGDGKSDIAGRVAGIGQWWVAVSNGSTQFSNQPWTSWSPAVTWVDVNAGNF